MRLTPMVALVVLAAAAASHAGAATLPSPFSSCSIDVDPVEFDLYDVFDTQPKRSTGEIRINCSAGITASKVALSTGLSANFQRRIMVGSGSSLGYNLYIDLSNTRIAGDGTNGTSLLQATSGTRAALAKMQRFYFYGTIQPLQAVAPGEYLDEVRVTVVF